MNKYNKYINKTEGYARKKEKQKLLLISLKLKRELLKYSYKTDIKDIIKCSPENIFKIALMDFSRYNESTKKYIKEEIINKLNKESLINIYLIMICNFHTEKNTENRDAIMNSFIQTCLIKDIYYDEKEKKFILTAQDGKKIQFITKLSNINQINEAKGQCHSISNFIAKQNKDQDINFVTMLVNNYVGEKQYHTVLVSNNVINDFAQNIVISFDDYKELYNPTIITFENAQKVYEEIEEIKIQDSEFDNGNAELLNYAIYKQLNKNNKRLIRK